MRGRRECERRRLRWKQRARLQTQERQQVGTCARDNRLKTRMGLALSDEGQRRIFSIRRGLAGGRNTCFRSRRWAVDPQRLAAGVQRDLPGKLKKLLGAGGYRSESRQSVAMMMSGRRRVDDSGVRCAMPPPLVRFSGRFTPPATRECDQPGPPPGVGPRITVVALAEVDENSNRRPASAQCNDPPVPVRFPRERENDWPPAPARDGNSSRGAASGASAGLRGLPASSVSTGDGPTRAYLPPARDPGPTLPFRSARTLGRHRDDASALSAGGDKDRGETWIGMGRMEVRLRGATRCTRRRDS